MDHKLEGTEPRYIPPAKNIPIGDILKHHIKRSKFHERQAVRFIELAKKHQQLVEKHDNKFHELNNSLVQV